MVFVEKASYDLYKLDMGHRNATHFHQHALA